jgi:biotin operon repressor
MLEWDEQLAMMVENVKAAVSRLKDEGVVAMSRRNFRSVVSVRGIYPATAARFDRLLDQAIAAAEVGDFLYD